MDIDKKSYHGCGKLYRNGIKIGRFKDQREVEVTPEYLALYDSHNGQDSPFSKGELLLKINLTDCEFERVYSEHSLD